MFCRLEILTRDDRGVQVIAIRYVTRASFVDVGETANRACQKLNASGYRISDLHTERVEEDWDDILQHRGPAMWRATKQAKIA